MTIDWTKPIETTAGKEAFYIGKRRNGLILVELCRDASDCDIIYAVNEKTGSSKHLTIRNVPEKPKIETRWINLYESIKSGCYFSKETADQGAARDRTGMIEITYKDGKPIDVTLHNVDDK